MANIFAYLNDHRDGPQGYSSAAPANASRVDVNSDKFIELFSELQMT
jgi:hypothetical protein